MNWPSGSRSARFLNAARVLPTPVASSRVPVLGPLIALVRRVASRLATHWYMAPILEQQQRFAEEVTATLDDLAGLVVLQDQQIAEIEARTSRQQEALAAELRQQMHELLVQVAVLSRHPAQGEGPYTICLDYPVAARPRYGHGRPPHPQLYALIAQNEAAYEQTLAGFLRYRDKLVSIPGEPQEGAPDAPVWKNLFLPGLDAVALYGFVADRNPKRYFEIGAGNSTRFVRRAIADHGLRTRVTSIDPCPRTEIADICDLAITAPVEDLDVRTFDELEPGDILCGRLAPGLYELGCDGGLFGHPASSEAGHPGGFSRYLPALRFPAFLGRSILFGAIPPGRLPARRLGSSGNRPSRYFCERASPAQRDLGAPVGGVGA